MQGEAHAGGRGSMPHTKHVPGLLHARFIGTTPLGKPVGAWSVMGAGKAVCHLHRGQSCNAWLIYSLLP